LLIEMSADSLQRVVQTLTGNPGSPRPHKLDLIVAIEQFLADPHLVRELIATAPPASAALLQQIRGQGAISVYELTPGQSGQSSALLAEWRAWSYQRFAGTPGPLVWLLERGMLLTGASYSAEIVVPAEVEFALRGRVFSSWQTTEPELELVAGGQGRPAIQLLSDLDGLLESVRVRPPTELQKGGLAQRDLQRLGVGLGLTAPQVDLLVELAGLIDLLESQVIRPEKRERSRSYGRVIQSQQVVMVPSAEVPAWRQASAHERWAAVVWAWCDLLAEVGAPSAWQAQPTSPLWNTPRLLAAILADVPPGQAATVTSLGARLAWGHPRQISDQEQGCLIVQAVGEVLAWMGAGDLGPGLSLTPLGRELLVGEPDLATLQQLFPTGVDTCTIQADLTVIVSGPPTSELGLGLGEMADLKSTAPARVYAVGEASLRRAFDLGRTAENILSFLDAHAPAGVPQNFRTMVEDVARRHGRLRVGAMSFYVRSDDPATIAELVSARKFKGLKARLLAPTVAAVEGKNLAQVVEALRAAGAMPTVDADNSAPTPRAVSPENSSSPSRAGFGWHRPVLDARVATSRPTLAQAEKLVESLKGSPRSIPGPSGIVGKRGKAPILRLHPDPEDDDLTELR
ncbi:MAG TPA: helicase-associated domain-containing protein, partial [Candidatus Dormibacteraeota bacterium]|nr:helicase-associated domain-containing protein [Candidatus Dormibacteraeota bacterium]